MQMGTQANVLLSSGEGAAVICQTNQKIKKKMFYNRQRACACMHTGVWGGVALSRWQVPSVPPRVTHGTCP